LWVSGPLLDPLRVDIHIEVPRVPYEKLTGERLGEPSSVVAARVEAARERQRQHFASHNSRVVCNAEMTKSPWRIWLRR
jgi:magnesium chelatase family protein